MRELLLPHNYLIMFTRCDSEIINGLELGNRVTAVCMIRCNSRPREMSLINQNLTHIQRSERIR